MRFAYDKVWLRKHEFLLAARTLPDWITIIECLDISVSMWTEDF